MLVSVVAATVFAELGIGVSIHSNGEWRSIHLAPTINDFELEHGSEAPRWDYNGRCMEMARATERAVLGEHAGVHDFFVPVESGGAEPAVIVAGPFATRRPTSAEVSARWYDIAHTRPHLADPAFARYLSATLAVVTLEGPLLEAFERLLSCFADLLSGQGDPERLAKDSDVLKHKLLVARADERMWERARSMVDERTTHAWSTPLMRDPLIWLGMNGPPEHVAVGLAIGRPDEVDPIDEALRRNAFQRQAVKLARARGNVTSGQVGERGITLLSASSGRGARARSALADLAARAADCARSFGFRLHVGIAVAADQQSLATRYRAGLAAAEKALSRGMSVVFAEQRPEPAGENLTHLRKLLAESVEGRSVVLVPRFERYASAVVVHSGYQLDAVRAHLEAGFERLTEPLLSTGRLDRKSYDEILASIDHALLGASTVAALVASYRNVVALVERAIESPTSARQHRSTQRARKFMREHAGEPLTLAQVARVAGFAPDYFSRLLKRDEGMTFDHYLQAIRLARAKQTLATTTLSVERIARLSGFKSRTYFQQVFRQHAGMTPNEYRQNRPG